MTRKLLWFSVALVAVLAGVWLAFERGGGDSNDVRPAQVARPSGDDVNTALSAQEATQRDSDPASRREQAADDSTPPSGVPEVVVFGRVVDARHFPVSRAHVVLLLGQNELARAESDERGGFELALAHRLERDEGLLVTASRGERELGSARATVRGVDPNWQWSRAGSRPEANARVDAGTVALSPAFTLEVRVTASNRPVADAQVSAKVGISMLDLGTVRTDERGIATISRVPAGAARVTAATPELEGRIVAYVPEESSVTIELLPRFTASISVVDKASGQPIPDARVALREMAAVGASAEGIAQNMPGEYMTYLAPHAPVPTNSEGLAVLADLGSRATYYLEIRADGFAKYPGQGSSGLRVAPDKQPMRIELERTATRTVRWPVIDGEVAAPVDGIEVIARREAGTRAWGEDDVAIPAGRVVERNLEIGGIQGFAGLIVETPDGAIARAWIDKDNDVGKPIAFRKPRTIDVIVREANATPVAGATVSARNQGNNTLNDPVRTDSDGKARISGLYGGLAEVYVHSKANASDVTAGSVDLEKGGGHLEVTLPPITRARLTLIVDGTPALPANYFVSSATGAQIVEEFPERGEVEISFTVPNNTASPKLSVAVTALGFLTASTEFALPSDGSEAFARLELERAATLLVNVAMPEKERVVINVQCWDEAQHQWRGAPPYFNGLSTPNAPHGSFRFFGLKAGRYRALDENSRTTSDEVEVLAAREATLAFDLANIEWVTGRVEPSNAEALDLARVLVEVEGGARLQPSLLETFSPVGTRLNGDGSFKVRVMRGHRSTIRAWHPWLASNSIVVEGGREGVVLELAAGNEVRIATPQLAELANLVAARICAYSGTAADAAIRCEAPLVNGALRFGGLAPGRYKIWVDPGASFAPLTLDDAELKAGVNELGPVSFTRGSTLRLRLQIADGAAAPRMFASAESEGSPSYRRQMSSEGDGLVELSGLAAGKFKLQYGAIMRMTGWKSTTFECDGKTDVELTVEPR
jgi:hypothetical protein